MTLLSVTALLCAYELCKAPGRVELNTLLSTNSVNVLVTLQSLTFASTCA